MNPAVPTSSKPRQGERGVALLEVLIAVLIFAFGVLGLVGLQASMTKAQSGAKYRADAANLASDFFGLAQTDHISHLPNYTTDSCKGYARCADWLEKLNANLPNAEFTATVAAGTGTVDLQLTWQQPGQYRNNYSSTMVWQQ